MTKNKKVIAITGRNGFIGNIIFNTLSAEYKVIGLVRKPKRDDEFQWDFMSVENIIEQLCKENNVEVIIHTAWDMHSIPDERYQIECLNGTKCLINGATKAGVKKIIFISTISAFPGCNSIYGQTKLAVEELITSSGGINLRLGLVYGENAKGMFGKIEDAILSSPIVPIIGSANNVQYLLHAETLSQFIKIILRSEFIIPSDPITLADPNPVKIRDIVRALSKKHNRRIFLLEIPWRIVYLVLRLLEALKLNISFKSDSVISFVYQNKKPNFSVINHLKLNLKPFDIM